MVIMRLMIWKMMLAVAVFAIALNVGLSYRWSEGYRRQAQFYAHVGKAALFRARNVESGAARLDDYTAEQKQKAVDQARRLADYSFRLKSKYERAVYLPWLPVEPDSPPFSIDSAQQ
jgi:hypothetical protein